MKNIIVSSLDEKSGKTIVALAIGILTKKRIGYVKPIGNNVVYKNKKVLDYDAILFKEIFSIDEPAEQFCLGMHHSKIIHFYKKPLEEFIKRYRKLAKNRDIVIIEGGEFLWKGSSINLDIATINEKIDGKTIFVLSGDYHEILDKLYYLHKIKDKLRICGIILNKIKSETVQRIQPEIEKLEFEFLGYLPHIKNLRATKIRHIVEKLFAKVVAGENGLDKYVENIFIAALSASEIKSHPDFKKERKLIITGGDRTDVITACFEKRTSGIILTNNIIPSANILAKANEKNIPLISLRPDTYTVAKLVENIQSVILPDEKEKIHEIQKQAQKHLNIEKILAD